MVSGLDSGPSKKITYRGSELQQELWDNRLLNQADILVHHKLGRHHLKIFLSLDKTILSA
jgi:hypothetical protein